MIDRIPFGRGGTFKKAAALGGKTQNADAVILLGTLPYMSPEQSRGEEVDSRSDIFSFGGVLYEMLTGVQPFLKDSAVETAHAILNEAPAPVSNYLDRTPVVLPHTVRKMLAKDPDRRYQRVCDVRIDLEELIGDSSQPSTESQAPMATSQWRQVLPWLLVGILVITVAMLVLIQSDEAPEGRGTVRFQIPPPEPELRVSAPMVSPDGKKIAFIGLDESGKRSLWVHKIDSSVAQKLVLPMPGGDSAGPGTSRGRSFLPLVREHRSTVFLRRVVRRRPSPNWISHAGNSRIGILGCNASQFSLP